MTAKREKGRPRGQPKKAHDISTYAEAFAFYQAQGLSARRCNMPRRSNNWQTPGKSRSHSPFYTASSPLRALRRAQSQVRK